MSGGKTPWPVNWELAAGWESMKAAVEGTPLGEYIKFDWRESRKVTSCLKKQKDERLGWR